MSRNLGSSNNNFNSNSNNIVHLSSLNNNNLDQENLENNIFVTNVNNNSLPKITSNIKALHDDSSEDVLSEDEDESKCNDKEKISEKRVEEKQVPSCRICFLSDSDENDPLLTPCKCTGSMSYIHYKCLKQCIQMKTTKKPNGATVCFLWKNYECEICLSEYPKYLTYKNLTYNMIDFDINFNEYMILDYTLFDDTKKKSIRKGFIIVDLNNEDSLANNNYITIGRTQSNTIKLKDISVSRMHCFFSRENGKFYINDKTSKFGTLIHLKNSIGLGNTNANKNFIAGKHLMNFDLHRSKWSAFTNFFSFTDNCCKCKMVDNDEIIFNEKTIEVHESNEKTEAKNKIDMLNDSCADYVIGLQTIIKHNENNNNDSFI